MTPTHGRLRLNDVVLFDGVDHFPHERHSVTIDGDRIAAVEPAHPPSPGEQVLELAGKSLIPGLIDAHFHAHSPSLDIAAADRTAPSHLAQYARRFLEDQLDRGFTTVRDAGGADPGLAQAVEEGLIAGPRLFVSGLALSQSGGHGHFRQGYEPCGCTGYAGSLACIVDGVEAMRRHVRVQLHAGVRQIKLFMSGGVISPTDPLWMDQFTDEEVAAAVDETRRRRTYVMAHAHSPSAIRRCVALGVRSVEHASLMDRETAENVARSDSFVVPTLAIIDYVSSEQVTLPPAMKDKALRTAEAAFEAVQFADQAGVRLGLGTDLFGEAHGRELQELKLRASVSGALAALRSATSINAEILQQAGELGAIRPGACADLLVLARDPVEDIEALTGGDGVLLLMKGGRIVRSALGDPTAER